jgi:hypothetical protein
MSSELVFDKPKRVVDANTKDKIQEAYFHFEQTNAWTDYNVTWDPVNTFVVPDDVLISILECYLQFASSYFVKPPSVEQMKKHIVNVFKSDHESKETDKVFTMYVSAIKIYAKKTELVWASCKAEQKEVSEQIPSDFLAPSRPSSPKIEGDTKHIIITSDPVSNAIMEAVADIPLQVGGGDAFRLDDDSEERMYRLRVLEAKLSAKIAKYKVKKEQDKYHSRFGRLPPDEDNYSEDETDYETEDEEDEI